MFTFLRTAYESGKPACRPGCSDALAGPVVLDAGGRVLESGAEEAAAPAQERAPRTLRPSGSAGLRSGQGQRQRQEQKPKEKPEQKGDTSNEVRKGTFLKSFDKTSYQVLTGLGACVRVRRTLEGRMWTNDGPGRLPAALERRRPYARRPARSRLPTGHLPPMGNLRRYAREN